MVLEEGTDMEAERFSVPATTWLWLISTVATTLLTIAVTLAGMVAFFLLPVAPRPAGL